LGPSFIYSFAYIGARLHPSQMVTATQTINGAKYRFDSSAALI